MKYPVAPNFADMAADDAYEICCDWESWVHANLSGENYHNGLDIARAHFERYYEKYGFPTYED